MLDEFGDLTLAHARRARFLAAWGWRGLRTNLLAALGLHRLRTNLLPARSLRGTRLFAARRLVAPVLRPSGAGTRLVVPITSP